MENAPSERSDQPEEEYNNWRIGITAAGRVRVGRKTTNPSETAQGFIWGKGPEGRNKRTELKRMEWK